MPRLFMLAAVLLLPFLPLATLSALADQVDGTPVDRVGTGATIASFENGLAAYLKGDYLKAVDLFRLTAAEGNAAARYYLGMAYEQGQGVAQDYSAATKWYQLAAEQGNAQAQYRLGALYEYGTGVIQDYERAFMWFDLSSASGKYFGVTRRQLVAKKMTAEQIEDAKRMEHDCQQRHLVDCG
jgi:TPR repeat protein